MLNVSSVELILKKIRQVVLPLLVFAAYCIVSLPAGASLGYLVLEFVLCCIMGLVVWGSCRSGVKYNLAILNIIGSKYYVFVVLVSTIICLGLSLADAALFGCLQGFYKYLSIKAFSLMMMYSSIALYSFVKASKTEETIDFEQAQSINSIHNISIKNGSEIKIIDVSDIIYLKADGDYVDIISTKGTYLKEQTMKYFAESLPCDSFVRIHRSYIINIKYLRSIESYGDYYMVLMSNGEKLRISATGYKLLKEKLNL